MNLLALTFVSWVHLSAISQSCAFSENSDKAEHHDDVTIENVSPSMTRFTRSVRDMPRQLHFNIVGKFHRFSLKLRRWRRSENVFMVYRFKGGQLQQLQLSSLTSAAALYQTSHSGDMFLVKPVIKNSTTDFVLHGSFWDQGKHFQLTPPSVMLGRTTHTVTTIEPINLFDDMLYPPTDTVYEKGNHTKTRRRVQRQSVAKRFIELDIVTDYPLFKRFLKIANNNADVAETEMAQYYRFVAASIDRRYQTITDHFPELKVRVLLSSLTICDNPSECPWSTENKISTDKIDYPKALAQFRDFLRKSGSPPADHKMFITGYQMARSDGSTGNIGISYVGTVCTDWSLSMVQDRFSGVTAGVASHELGHSLSARHDDYHTYTGCSNQHFIMNSYASFPTSDNAASRPYYFSNCSAKSIANYLKGDRGSCTINYPRSVAASVSPAGQHFDADAQCMIYYGVGSRFCRAIQKLIGFDKMCVRISCSQPGDPHTCLDVVPLDRTSCGDSQWCIQGVCVYSAEAPRKPKDCPQGDDPEVSCVVDICRNETTNLTLCCQTCSDLINNTSGLERKATTALKAETETTPTVNIPKGNCGFMCQCRKMYSRPYCWMLSVS